MKTLDLDRFTLCVAITAALLSGCGQPLSSGAIPNGHIVSTIPAGKDASVGASQAFGAIHSYKTLYRFQQFSLGDQPLNLVALNGKLYGITAEGGSSTCGCGTVFEMDTSGRLRVLYSFSGGTDGAYPAELIVANSTLYGVTLNGGSAGCGGCGTVFSVSTSGKESVLYRFKGQPDGDYPQGLTFLKGMLYGVTALGGSGSSCGQGCGTVFKLSLAGKEEVIYSFKGGRGGDGPAGNLAVLGHKLYGVTISGGLSGCLGYGQRCGTVFAVTTGGKERTVYRFAGPPDGAGPDAGLVTLGGSLYGTTSLGGSCGNSGCGTVFETTTGGKESILHSFNGDPDGGRPQAPLTQMNGVLYGTTTGGGAFGYGMVFSLTTSGKEVPLHQFKGGEDGAAPYAGLVSLGGQFYGSTVSGGGGTGCSQSAGGCGTIFRVSP